MNSVFKMSAEVVYFLLVQHADLCHEQILTADFTRATSRTKLHKKGEESFYGSCWSQLLHLACQHVVGPLSMEKRQESGESA